MRHWSQAKLVNLVICSKKYVRWLLSVWLLPLYKDFGEIWKCIVCTSRLLVCTYLQGFLNKNNLDSAIEIKTKF